VRREDVLARTRQQHTFLLANRSPEAKSGSENRTRGLTRVAPEHRATNAPEAQLLDDDGRDSQVDSQEPAQPRHRAAETKQPHRLPDQLPPNVFHARLRPRGVGHSFVEHQAHEPGQPGQHLRQGAPGIEQDRPRIGPRLEVAQQAFANRQIAPEK
jgi:hypothetical protein